jgi:Helicase associated domain
MESTTTSDSDPIPVRTIYDLKWEELYQRLRAYHLQHGHTNVPYRHRDDPKLGRWGA